VPSILRIYLEIGEEIKDVTGINLGESEILISKYLQLNILEMFMRRFWVYISYHEESMYIFSTNP
jgi:hypothetical protein